MKLLLVVHGFPPGAGGGAEIYAHAHATAMRDRWRHDILVLTRDADPARAEYDVRTEQIDGLKVVRINNTFRNTRSFQDTYVNPAIETIAAQAIDSFGPDVAHIHHLTCLSTTIVELLAARGIPVVHTLHDYWLFCHRGQMLDLSGHVCNGRGLDRASSECHDCIGASAGGRAMFAGAALVRQIERRLPAAAGQAVRSAAERTASALSMDRQEDDASDRRLAHMRSICRRVDRFVAPSQHMLDTFVRFGIERERLTLSGYGFDSTSFAIHPRRPGDRLRIGFLGTLMLSKAPHLVIEAVRLLPAGSASVEMFGTISPYHGDDSYRDRLTPLLAEPFVQLHGPVAHEDVPRILAGIDVLAVPSIWQENSPLVIQEAFMAGVPVVASRIGGIPEFVRDSHGGLLFEPGISTDLARVLRRFLDEPELLGRLRANIPAVRSLTNDVDETAELYESLLREKSARRPAVAAARPSAAAVERPGAASLVRPPRLAAVILNYQTPSETILAAKALLASDRPIDHLIVVDNSPADSRTTLSPADSRPALTDSDAWRSIASRVHLIQNDANLGFSGGMNVGIRAALAQGAERVLLVNSDVVFPPDAIGRLERSLAASSGAGICGPVVVSRSMPDRIASRGMRYRSDSGRMRHLAFNDATASSRGAGDEAEAVDAVSGCAMLITREVFDAIGLLDEAYFFSFEDLDFCLRARRAGYATILSAGATVHHEGGQSIGPASPRRLYFAARNHLRLARQVDPDAAPLAGAVRTGSIVLLNFAHAARCRGGSPLARWTAVIRGIRDYARGRFGTDLPGSSD